MHGKCEKGDIWKVMKMEIDEKEKDGDADIKLVGNIN